MDNLAVLHRDGVDVSHPAPCVRTLLGMADLIRVTRGVWRRPDELADFAARCAAILGACPAGTVVAGCAAAQLHGLWLPPSAARTIDVVLRRDAVVPRAHSHSMRAELRSRRRTLHPDEVVLVGGVPATSAARTWLDLSEFLTMPDLVALGDSVLRGGETGLADLADVLSRAYHRRGVVRARQALPLLNARSRSRPESHFRYALVSAGLPAPDVNLPIYNELGEWLAEPDLSYSDAMLALEYNGAEHAEANRMRRDYTRAFDVQHRGRWRVETFGPAEIFGRPDQTAQFVKELRRERLRGLRRSA